MGQIQDNGKSLVSVTSQFGNPIRFCDDGFGPLWVYRESLGIVGIVRAQKWEDALECVLDDIMDDADPEYLADPGYEVAEGDLPEGCHYRPNGGYPGSASKPWAQTCICQEDLNGAVLEPLTQEMVDAEGIVLTWEE
jgi:hypothetical protein